MKNLHILLFTDFKKIFRDSTLTMIFFVPVFIIVILRFVLSFVISKWVPEIEEYTIYFATMLSMLTAAFPSFIMSFIMLDEKDEGLFDVMKVLPFSPFAFFIYRIGFIIVFGTCFSFITMILSDAFPQKAVQLMGYSFQYGLFSASMGIFISTVAKNKIEGVTYFKVLSSILALPLVAFFVPEKFAYLFGIFPLHWTYQAIISGDYQTIFFLIGLIYNLILLAFFYKLFRLKAFR